MPNAFTTMLTPDEQQKIAYINEARAILDFALENNDMVKKIVQPCIDGGLVKIDMMTVLCANLLYQHDQGTEALLNMKKHIEQLQRVQVQELQTQVVMRRRVIETWLSGSDKRYCRCDDGTVWMLQTGGDEVRWVVDRKAGAMIPQGPV